MLIALCELQPAWTLTGGAHSPASIPSTARPEISICSFSALVEAGVDLARAFADCPGQDAGFSPLTFARCTRALPVRRVTEAQGWSDAEIDALEQFRVRSCPV